MAMVASHAIGGAAAARMLNENTSFEEGHYAQPVYTALPAGSNTMTMSGVKAELARLFNMYDMNGDNKITMAEMVEFESGQPDPYPMEKLFKEFKEADQDNDGLITRGEFYRVGNYGIDEQDSDEDTVAEGPESFLPAQESNNDGEITFEDILDFTQRNRLPYSLKHLEQEFQSVDRDNNGILSLGEYYQASGGRVRSRDEALQRLVEQSYNRETLDSSTRFIMNVLMQALMTPDAFKNNPLLRSLAELQGLRF